MESRPGSREYFVEQREGVVAEAVRELLLPLAEEQPHARWSQAQVVEYISETTGYAKALVVGHLNDLAERKQPLDDEGYALHLGRDRGQGYFQITAPSEPIRNLPEDLHPGSD